MKLTLTTKQKERLAEILCESVGAYGFKDQPSIFQNKVRLGAMAGDARRIPVIEKLREKGCITLYDGKGSELEEACLCEEVMLTKVGFQAAKDAMPTFYHSTFGDMLAHAQKNRDKPFVQDTK